MMEFIIIALSGVLATLGGMALIHRRRRKVRGLLPSHASAAAEGVVMSPTAAQIGLGDELQFMRSDDIEASTYSVEAMSTYTDDDDETWSEFEIHDLTSDRRYFLSYAEDDEARWRWSLFRQISQQELDAPDIYPVIADIGPSKHQAPPKELAFLGRQWRAERGSHHYKVWVEDRRRDRQKRDKYKARMSDYREIGGTLRLSIEVWDDGMSVSVTEGTIDDLTRIRR